MGLIKLKNFCTAKETIKNEKQLTELKKIIANDMTKVIGLQNLQ